MQESVSPEPAGSPPRSATSAGVAFVAIAAFILSTVILYKYKPFLSITHSAMFSIFFTAAVIFTADILWQKIHRRESTGLDFSRNTFSFRRSLCKFVGLIGSFAFVGLLYWLFPEYHGGFYDHYYQMLGMVLPVWILASIPYIMWVDRIMRDPYDGYWHMGKVVMLRWDQVNGAVLRQHLFGWLIKGYFLPLMFVYFCSDLEDVLDTDFTSMPGFQSWYDFLFGFFFFIDLGLVSMGYIFSMRVTDTHLRSAEPTLLGWAAALVCYEPFWSMTEQQYLHYGSDYDWESWLAHSPLLYILWGGMILVLTGIYAWTTVCFGARFSNLTHRGIITIGPYRYTKHPAYISKNLSWWLGSIPFIAHGGLAQDIRGGCLLLILNGIYWLRAKTEERHLARDPVYVEYMRWMEQNGIFRFLMRSKRRKVLYQ